MSPTLSRYIAARFLTTLLGAAAIVYALTVLIGLLELLRRNDGGEADFLQLLSIAALTGPKIALMALPFTAMLASLASFARMARASELIVTRAAGVSAWSIIAPAAAVATAIGVLGFSGLNPLAAATAMRAETLKDRLWSGGQTFSISGEGLWLRQPHGAGQIVIYARGADASASMVRDVTFFVYEGANVISARIDAARATLAPGLWRLEDATRRDLDPGADAPLAPPETFDALTLDTNLTPAQILESFSPPETISFWSLPEFIRALEAAGFAADRHRLHWHAQLAQPLLLGAMVMIGAAFSMRHARQGGLGAMALWAVVTGFAFYFITDVSKTLGANGQVAPALAAWAPPAAAALFAAGLLLHLEDG
jgi:lipopolysaccharide export system permease protein